MSHLSSASLLARILEAVAYPTFVVDLGLDVLHANGAAERFFGRAGGTESSPRRLGDFLGCDGVGGQPGCGFSRGCDRCVIRASVRRALQGHAVRRVLAVVERQEPGGKREICLQVSAAAIEHERRKLAVVTLDEANELFNLRSLVAMTPARARVGRS